MKQYSKSIGAGIGGGIGSAVGIVVIYLIESLGSMELPENVDAAIITIVTAIVSALVTYWAPANTPG